MSGRRRRSRSHSAKASARRVPPLHALEDQIVARLQREMEMRHEPRLLGDGAKRLCIDLDRIERRQPQPLELRHQLQDPPNESAERRPARQVGAVGGDVDAGQHHLADPAGDQPADLLDRDAGRNRARAAAADRG